MEAYLGLVINNFMSPTLKEIRNNYEEAIPSYLFIEKSFNSFQALYSFKTLAVGSITITEKTFSDYAFVSSLFQLLMTFKTPL